VQTTNVRDYIDAARRLPAPDERRRIRLDAGLSLRQVGASLGVTGAAVQQWEIGQSTPRDNRLVEYVELLEWLKERAR
jgi:transcriptional regulator with XRE-family HTH domain